MAKVTSPINLQSKTTDQTLEPLEALCTQIKKGTTGKTSFDKLQRAIEAVITNGTLFQT